MKRLSTMKLSELAEFVDKWDSKMFEFKPGSIRWKLCRMMRDRGVRQLELVNWIKQGFKKLED